MALRLARLVFACVLSMQCVSCTFARMVYFTTPSLNAPAYFEERPVRASPRPRPFARLPSPVAFPIHASRSATYDTFEKLLAENDTRALVVLHHDVIVYERYFGDVTAETRLPCFSASKTFAAVLVGCALDDGLIASLQQHLVDYVPELATRPGYADITLEHLLRMTSGIDFEEESISGAVLYYTPDVRSKSYDYDVKYRAGTHFEYGSVNTQLLWEALHRPLRQETVAHYFQERFWSPLGAESSAAWALDSAAHGVEKLSSGFSATARDYARLGVLFQHGGRAGTEQIVPEQWVKDSLVADDVAGVVTIVDGPMRRGRYQWFLTLDGCCYFAKGYHGQYVFVDRVRDVVVVRFGEGYGDVDWTGLFEQMARTL